MLVIKGLKDRKEVDLGGIKFVLAPLSYQDINKVIVLSKKAQSTEDKEESLKLEDEVNMLMLKKQVKDVIVDGGIGIEENGEIKEFKLEFQNEELTQRSVEVLLTLGLNEELSIACYNYFLEFASVKKVEGVKKTGKSKGKNKKAEA